jgi:hypothetical protein
VYVLASGLRVGTLLEHSWEEKLSYSLSPGKMDGRSSIIIKVWNWLVLDYIIARIRALAGTMNLKMVMRWMCLITYALSPL